MPGAIQNQSASGNIHLDKVQKVNDIAIKTPFYSRGGYLKKLRQCLEISLTNSELASIN